MPAIHLSVTSCGAVPVGQGAGPAFDLLGHVVWVPVLSTALGLVFAALLVILGLYLHDRRTGERLQQEHNRLGMLLDSTDQIVLVYDREHRCTYYNGSSAFGVRPEEVVGKRVDDLFGPDEAAVLRGQNEQIFQTAQPAVFENELVWRGRTYWFRNQNHPICDPGGRVTGVVKFCSDITEYKQLQQEMEVNEQRFRIAAEASSDLIFDWDLQTGDLTWIGDRSGLSESSEIDWADPVSLAQLVHPEDRAEYEQVIRAVRSDEIDTQTLELRLWGADGKYHYWVARGAVLRQAGAGRRRWIGAASDITAQRDQQQALQESKEQFEMLMRNLDEVVWSGDTRGYVTYASPALERITGYDVEPFKAKAYFWFELVHPEDRDAVTARHRQLIQNGQHELEYRIITRSGQVRWIRDRSTVVRDADGHVVRYGGICTDITARKQAEHLLLESEQTYKALFENSNAVKLLIDPSTGKIVDANQAAARYYGYRGEKLKGMDIREINIMGPEEVAHAMARARKLQDNHFIFRHRLADGRVRDVEVYSNPIEIRGRDLLFSIIHDITDRRRAERALLDHERQLQRMASELALVEERQRQALAAALHDRIGQSLAALKVRAGLLREAAGQEEITERADRMIQDLDNLMQEAWNLTFDICPPVLYEVGLDAALEGLVEEFGQTHRIQAEFYADGRDRCIANDIRGMLYQMARELLQNTAKHAGADCVKLSIRLDRQALRITVEDDGRGFEDPAVTSPTKQKTGGFGLFSIRERLGHMGGRMEVRRGSEGAGACVTIVLPLKAAYLKEPEDGHDQNTPGRRSPVDAGRSAGASREAG